MLQKFTANFLCLTMVGMSIMPQSSYAVDVPFSATLNEAELINKYPDAKVIQVLPEQYHALEKELQQRGYRQSEIVPFKLAQNNIEEDGLGVKSQQVDSIVVDDCSGKKEESAGDESMRVMLDFTEDMLNTSSSSSGDDAAVVFVVIGTVVVMVWVLYVFKYFYDVTLGNAPCGNWNEMTIIRNSASVGTGQHARFNGLRYSTGFRDGSLDVGIGLELGQADILLSEIGTLELQGRYWMLGPILRWRVSQNTNPNYFHMSFLAGSTEHDAVGMLARASLGLLFGVGENMQLGVSWGVMNINLDENQGIILERSQYHYLYGINVGFKF